MLLSAFSSPHFSLQSQHHKKVTDSRTGFIRSERWSFPSLTLRWDSDSKWAFDLFLFRFSPSASACVCVPQCLCRTSTWERRSRAPPSRTSRWSPETPSWTPWWRCTSAATSHLPSTSSLRTGGSVLAARSTRWPSVGISSLQHHSSVFQSGWVKAFVGDSEIKHSPRFTKVSVTFFVLTGVCCWKLITCKVQSAFTPLITF